MATMTFDDAIFLLRSHHNREVLMELEIEATYENGILKPDQALPLENGQRVKLIVQKVGSAVERLYGMIQWKGSQEDLDYLLGPDNHPSAREE